MTEQQGKSKETQLKGNQKKKKIEDNAEKEILRILNNQDEEKFLRQRELSNDVYDQRHEK